MLASIDCAFVKLVVILAFVIVICASFISKFLNKTLINVVFVILAIKILSKLAIA